MFIVTAKLSRPKLIAAICGAAALIVLIILLANRGSGDSVTVAGKARLETPESKVAFLADCGYAVSPDPARVQEVQIPQDFTEVYTQYNVLQKSQGFDLAKYKGKTVMQYVFQVENYPDQNADPVYATLLLYKNKLIGADLSRGGADSFLRPLLIA